MTKWPTQVRRPPGPAAKALVTPCECGGGLRLYCLGGKAHGACCDSCGKGIPEPMPTRKDAAVEWLVLQGVKVVEQTTQGG